MIRSRVKTLEGRIGYPSMKRIDVGSTILLLTGDKNQWERNKKNFPAENILHLKVVAVRGYKDFNEALSKESVGNLLPGYNTREAIAFYNQISPPEKVKQYGVIIFEFKLTE